MPRKTAMRYKPRMPRPPHRRLAPLLLLAAIPLLPRSAAAQDLLALIRADRWTEADNAAGKYLDPVARKLVTWYRLQSPGAAGVAEIDTFMAQNPDWPGQAMLARRREEALAAEPDDSAVRGFCARLTLHTAPALLRCAEAEQGDGETAAATASAKRAWVTGITDPAAETRFMQRWGDSITPTDQWRRFDHLAWSDPTSAARQLARLDAARRRAGETRLALRRGDPKAPVLLAGLPAELRAEPTLMLDEARRLRITNQEQAAFALWRSAGDAAQHDAAPEHLPAYWTERSQLARILLQQGDATGAYALAAGNGQTDPESLADAEFLAGWIALRRLDDPAGAAGHFLRVIQASKAAITQARGHYWLGRALAARSDTEGARAEFAAAAHWPTTYYGQLAALAAGDDAAALNARINATRDPDWTSRQAVAFAGGEVARAAELLVAWGESYRARPFLLRLQELGPDPVDEAMAARLALGFAMPDEAVSIARRAGRDGIMLADVGWPETIEPPPGPVDPAATLGLIRQESSFDTTAASPAGARGLMQLMPATAAGIARKLGVPDITPASLILDPDQNMRLGTSYLQSLLDQFGNQLPLAFAAYNAGPGRVQQWLAANGDPRSGQIDMIDWIELIPFNETRNYVQRVIENTTIYRARHGITAPHPLAPWRG